MTEDIPHALRERDAAGADDFEVLRHIPTHHCPTKPLIVLIHPGDLIEHETGWASDDWQQVQEFSQANIQGTAEDLGHWRSLGADFVVLHRSSCSQFEPDGPYFLDSLFQEIAAGWSRGTVLYGDDLDVASNWIIENLQIASRPHIYLAGAYSDPDHGCLTAVGKRLEAIRGGDCITVSEWSPPSSCPGPVWRPATQILGIQPALAFDPG